MKNMNLNALYVRELDEDEQSEIRGGFLPAAFAIALMISAINNYGDIREGFTDGYYGSGPRY